jgi:sugar-specific transcriptional regulator TrmB
MQILDTAIKLQALGLTDKQARVYAATLFLGSATALAISKQADLNRSTTYVILDELIAMKVVSQAGAGGKTVFMTEGPVALAEWLRGEAERIKQRQAELAKLSAQLETVSRGSDADTPQVRFIRGQDGVNAENDYFYRKARRGSTLYAYENIDEVSRIFPERPKDNNPKRVSKGIHSRIIFSYKAGELPMGKEVLRQGIKVNKPVKADFNLFENGMTMSTYGRTPDDTVGIAIESPEIIAAMRDLFGLLWDTHPNKLT